jgi:hypothetical protein
MKPKKAATRKTSATPKPATGAARAKKKVSTRKSAVVPEEIPAEPPKSATKRKRVISAPGIRTSAESTAAPKRKAVRRSVKLPDILLEGDQLGAPLVSGPGEKYALGPTPPTQQFTAAELPESYGTKRLYLTARDPHWLYANWDLTQEQQAGYNRKSIDGHLILRVTPAGPPANGGAGQEVHVHPESRHWFVHVDHAGTRYTAELGFYGKGQKWNSIATSGATLTPPETISEEALVEFSTLPVDVPFEKLLAIVRDAVRTHQPLARAIEELRREGHRELPSVKITASATTPWTPAQERALAEVVSVDEVRRVWIGSLEVTELVRRHLEREISSITAAELGRPGVGAVTSVSSPFGAERPAAKGFWFNINAELIIYGATEPDATVTIGGRKIKLRHDGSFSYRFSLPDGRYDLPVVAVSADETDGRAAELKFTRATEIRGDVGTHPQDPALKPPTPENV